MAANDGKAARVEPVTFTRPAAERIAKVVRKVEAGDRSAKPLTFERVAQGAKAILKVGTFTGTWATGTYKTVTLNGSTQTASVYNWTTPVVDTETPSTADTQYVIFGKASGTNSAVEIQFFRPRIRLGKTISAVPRASAAQIALYKDEPVTCVTGCELGEFASAGETVCAQNLIDDIPANAWVYVVRPQGSQTYHIIGRGKTQAEADEENVDLCGRVDTTALTVQFSACYGTGAMGTASVLGDCPGPINSVTVNDGGIGYALKARIEPVIAIYGSGTGATFTTTFTQLNGDCGIPKWRINTVSVAGGGGYSDNEQLDVVGDTRTVIVACPKLTLQANEDGIPSSVDVIDGGEMYKEDDNGQPYVATVTVTITQLPPSVGSGAILAATVNSNVNSTAFGSITGVTISNAGDDYVNQVATYPLRSQGFWFSKLPAYDGSKTQLLGHSDAGCLQWFDVTACGTAVPYGVCCDGTAIDTTITSETACTAATMTWVANKYATDLPPPCCDIEPV